MNHVSFGHFNWADFLMVAIVIFSLLISLVRGFIREACSLLTWGLALVLTIRFTPVLSDIFNPYIETSSLRIVCAGAILFVTVLVIGGLMGYLVTQLVNKTGLTGTDRLLGLIFGFARGVLVTSVLILLATLTAIPQDPWWSQSVLIKASMPMVTWLQYFLPEKIANLSSIVSTNILLTGT